MPIETYPGLYLSMPTGFTTISVYSLDSACFPHSEAFSALRCLFFDEACVGNYRHFSLITREIDSGRPFPTRKPDSSQSATVENCLKD